MKSLKRDSVYYNYNQVSWFVTNFLQMKKIWLLIKYAKQIFTYRILKSMLFQLSHYHAVKPKGETMQPHPSAYLAGGQSSPVVQGSSVSPKHRAASRQRCVRQSPRVPARWSYVRPPCPPSRTAAWPGSTPGAGVEMLWVISLSCDIHH